MQRGSASLAGTARMKTKERSSQYEESVPLYGRKALLTARKGSLQCEETPSFYQRDASFICKQCYSRPSPFGEGLGVRLFFPLGGGWVEFPCHYVLLSKTSATTPMFLCYSVFKNPLLCLQKTCSSVFAHAHKKKEDTVKMSSM